MAIGTIAASGCALTEVGLVSVHNETTEHLRVRSQLSGNDWFEPPMDLAPSEKHPLLKYEEGRFRPEPIAKLVHALEIVNSGGCVARLEDGALARASTRDPEARRWTVHLRAETLDTGRCSPAATREQLRK